MQERRQGRRKAAQLDAHRRDVRFAVGDEVLLDTERAPRASRRNPPGAALANVRFKPALAVRSSRAQHPGQQLTVETPPSHSTSQRHGLPLIQP